MRISGRVIQGRSSCRRVRSRPRSRRRRRRYSRSAASSTLSAKLSGSRRGRARATRTPLAFGSLRALLACSELYRRDFLGRFGRLEVGLLGEAEELGDQQGREALGGGVVLAHRVVVAVA